MKSLGYNFFCQLLATKTYQKCTPMPTDSHDYPFGRMLELQERSNFVTEDFSIII